MKFANLIGFGVAGLLSLGVLLVNTRQEAVQINRDFSIETLSGDASVLNHLAVTGILQENSNRFSRFEVANGAPIFEDTRFDVNGGMSEEHLEHRELYRGMWAPLDLRTDDYVVTAQFDAAFNWNSRRQAEVRIGILDRATGETTIYTHHFPELSFGSNVWGGSLAYQNNSYYYVLANPRQQNFAVYEIDMATGSLSLKHEIPFTDGVSSGNDFHIEFAAGDSTLFAWMSGATSSVMMRLDLENGTAEARTTEQIAGAADSLWPVWSGWGGGLQTVGDQLFFEGQEERFLYDWEADSLKPLATPERVMEVVNSSNWGWSNSTVTTENYLIQQFSISSWDMNGMSPENFFFAVYDKNTLELLFEGNLPLFGNTALQSIERNMRVIER